jgi:hypothetical protein
MSAQGGASIATIENAANPIGLTFSITYGASYLSTPKVFATKNKEETRQ